MSRIGAGYECPEVKNIDEVSLTYIHLNETKKSNQEGEEGAAQDRDPQTPVIELRR